MSSFVAVKYLLPLLLVVTALSLHAAPKVQLDCRFVSSPKPVFGELGDIQAQNAELSKKGVTLPPDFISITGIFTADQIQATLARLRRDRAEIVSLPSRTATSRRAVEIDTMIKGPSTEVLGDFSRYGIKPVKVTSGPPTDIGLRLSCRPTVGPDGYTIDCDLKYRSSRLKGFEETLLTGKNSSWLDTATLSASSGNADFPRIRQPIFVTQEVSTSLTLYDGQTVVFSLRDKELDPTASAYEYTLITVRTVK